MHYRRFCFDQLCGIRAFGKSDSRVIATPETMPTCSSFRLSKPGVTDDHSLVDMSLLHISASWFVVCRTYGGWHRGARVPSLQISGALIRETSSNQRQG